MTSRTGETPQPAPISKEVQFDLQSRVLQEVFDYYNAEPQDTSEVNQITLTSSDEPWRPPEEEEYPTTTDTVPEAKVDRPFGFKVGNTQDKHYQYVGEFPRPTPHQATMRMDPTTTATVPEAKVDRPYGFKVGNTQDKHYQYVGKPSQSSPHRPTDMDDNEWQLPTTDEPTTTINLDYLQRKDDEIKDLTSTVHALHTRNAVVETEYNNLVKENRHHDIICNRLETLLTHANTSLSTPSTITATASDEPWWPTQAEEYPTTTDTVPEAKVDRPSGFKVGNTQDKHYQHVGEFLRPTAHQATRRKDPTTTATAPEAKVDRPSGFKVGDTQDKHYQYVGKPPPSSPHRHTDEDDDEWRPPTQTLSPSQQDDQAYSAHQQLIMNSSPDYPIHINMATSPLATIHQWMQQLKPGTPFHVPYRPAARRSDLGGESLSVINVTSGSEPYKGLTLPALKDTGSTYTLIDRNTYYSNPCYTGARVRKVWTTVTTVDPNDNRTCSEVADLYLTFESRDKKLITFLHPVFLVENIGYQFVIGHDILATRRTLYSTPDSVALIRDVSTPTKFEHPDKNPNVFIIPTEYIDVSFDDNWEKAQKERKMYIPINKTHVNQQPRLPMMKKGRQYLTYPNNIPLPIRSDRWQPPTTDEPTTTIDSDNLQRNDASDDPWRQEEEEEYPTTTDTVPEAKVDRPSGFKVGNTQDKHYQYVGEPPRPTPHQATMRMDPTTTTTAPEAKVDRPFGFKVGNTQDKHYQYVGKPSQSSPHRPTDMNDDERQLPTQMLPSSQQDDQIYSAHQQSTPISSPHSPIHINIAISQLADIHRWMQELKPGTPFHVPYRPAARRVDMGGECLSVIDVTSGSEPFKGLKLPALKDTGATYTMIDRATFYSNPCYNGTRIKRISAVVTTVNPDDNLTCNEVAELYLTFESQDKKLITFLHPVYLVTNIGFQLVIGHDILASRRTIYSTLDSVALMRDVSIPTKFQHLDKDPNIFIIPTKCIDASFDADWEETQKARLMNIPIKKTQVNQQPRLPMKKKGSDYLTFPNNIPLPIRSDRWQPPTTDERTQETIMPQWSTEEEEPKSRSQKRRRRKPFQPIKTAKIEMASPIDTNRYTKPAPSTATKEPNYSLKDITLAEHEAAIDNGEYFFDLRTNQVKLAHQLPEGINKDDLPTMEDLMNLGFGLRPEETPLPAHKQKLHKRQKPIIRPPFTRQQDMVTIPDQLPAAVNTNWDTYAQLEQQPIVIKSSKASPIEIVLHPQSNESTT